MISGSPTLRLSVQRWAARGALAAAGACHGLAGRLGCSLSVHILTRLHMDWAAGSMRGSRAHRKPRLGQQVACTVPCRAARGSLAGLSCSRGWGCLIIAPQVNGLLQGGRIQKHVPASVAEVLCSDADWGQAASMSLCRHLKACSGKLTTPDMACDV